MPCEGLGLKAMIDEHTERASQLFVRQASYLADHFLEPQPGMEECDLTESSTGKDLVTESFSCYFGDMI